ncbi:polysaccharide deacetylase family protein [Neobacillus mesonae]|nr:polysaccharide deacetylase family protein [Neobacillus mesonae]
MIRKNRKRYVNMGVLDDLAESALGLAEKAATDYVEVKKNFVPPLYNGPILVFVDDDITESVLTKWKPIADAKGIKVTLGAVTDNVGTSGKLNLEQLKRLQNEGYEIVSHTKTHPNLNSLTEAQLEVEFGDSYKWLVNNGFGGANTVVYPYGIEQTSLLVKKVARKYYEYGIDNKASLNISPMDSFFVGRTDSDYATLTSLRSRLDTAIAQNGLLVVLTHSWRPEGDINSTGTFSVEKISQFIDYAKSKNVPIMTFGEAVKLKGNVFSVGEYTDEKSFYVARDGSVKGQFGSGGGGAADGIKVLTDSSLPLGRSMLEYDVDVLTVQPVSNTADNLLNTGGTSFTFRSSGKNFSFQMFRPYNVNDLYMRYWNEIPTTPAWSSWQKVSSALIVRNNDGSTMDAAITTYTRIDTETIVPLSAARDNYQNKGGVMKVFRSSVSGYSYAIFIPKGTAEQHIRWWDEATSAWLPWAST